MNKEGVRFQWADTEKETAMRKTKREVIQNTWKRESFGLQKYRLPVAKGMMNIISCICNALSARFKEYWLLSYRK